jgi:hypothetical protein
MIHMDKCKKKCDVVTFSENKMSTKMLKAMMLKMGSGKISYHNSRTRSTHTIIMSLDYLENRLLLLRYRYKLYYHYVKTLSNINRDLYSKILQMLDTLVEQLTTDERNIVFDTPPPEPPIPETYEDSGIVFKVVVKRLKQFSYFILINIKNSYIFETGLFYTFDVSDPTNLGAAFCVSLEKDGIAYDCRYDLTPGEPGATMKLYISKSIPYTHLYVFNKEEESIGIRYEQWGYSYKSLFVNRDKAQIDEAMSATFKSFTTSYLKFAVYDWYGPKIMMDPFVAIEPDKSSNPVRLYKNTYMYKFGIGVYYIYLNNHYSLAFLNRNKSKVGISSQYNRGIKRIDQLFIAGSGLDGDYTFHSGMIRLTVTGPFDPISLYNDKYGYMGGLFMIQYSEENLKTAVPDEFVSTNIGNRYGLDSQTLMDPSTFTFQNIPYNPVNRFALAPGDYIFYNTSNIPVALLNKGKESWISIEGIRRSIVNGFTINDSIKDIGPNGEEYEFYYGAIWIRVRGNFGSCSLYTPRKGLSEGGYRGGYSLLEYDASFNNLPSYVVRDMDPPVITINNAISTIPIEATPKPLLLINLNLNEYALTTAGLYKGSVQQGNVATNDMRFKLEARPYTFLLDGVITVYGKHALLNTRSVGLNSILYGLYPVYNSTFFVDPVFIEDFCIVYVKGSVKYTYFFTYQN